MPANRNPFGPSAKSAPTGKGSRQVPLNDRVLPSQQQLSQAQIDANNLATREAGERDPMRAILSQLASQSNPVISAGALDPAVRQQQMALISQLQAQAAGQGPSLAQQQFQQAGNTALQKTMGAVRAGVGSNPALAARTAALAGTNLLGNIAAESGMARLKEQQDAQNALAQQLAARQTLDIQQRQQDIGLAQAQADAALKQQALRQQAALGNIQSTENLFGRIHGNNLQAQRGQGGGGSDFLSALIPAAATVAGGMLGGPAGAAAGGVLTGGLAGAGDKPTSAQSPSGGYASPNNGGTMMSLTGTLAKSAKAPATKKPTSVSAFDPIRRR